MSLVASGVLVLASSAFPAGGDARPSAGKAHFALVKLHPDFVLGRADLDQALETVTTLTGAFALQLDCRVDQAAAGGEENEEPGRCVAQVMAKLEDSTWIFQVELRGDGRLKYVSTDWLNLESRPRVKLAHGYPSGTWHRIRIEHLGGHLRFLAGGKLIAEERVKSGGRSQMHLNCYALRCRASFRNIRQYVPSAKPVEDAKLERLLRAVESQLVKGEQAAAGKSCRALHEALGGNPGAAPFLEPLKKRLMLLEHLSSDTGLDLATGAHLKLCGFNPKGWELKGEWLEARPIPPDPPDPKVSIRMKDYDGTPMKTWGALYVPTEPIALEITGLLDRDVQTRKAYLQLTWGSPDFDVEKPHLVIRPDRVSLHTGRYAGPGLQWKQTRVAEARIARNARPTRFCLRIRDGRCAFFWADGRKPLLTAKGLPPVTTCVALMHKHFPEDRLPRFGRVTLRRLPDKARLQAPAWPAVEAE